MSSPQAPSLASASHFTRAEIEAGRKLTDAEVLKTLDKAAVNYQVVLTKADAARQADLAALVVKTQTALAEHPAAHPDVLVTSARSRSGIPELRAAMARLINERGGG